MKFYNNLAEWWPLFSAPEDYEEEAALYHAAIQKYRPDVRTALELGSGGGNNALWMKKHYEMTLVDIAPGMVEVSQGLNPECQHHVGDMRDFSLARTFDLVFIHDAIMFISTREDLQKVFQVAAAHLAPNGILFITPDYFRETFEPGSDSGGHDADDGTHKGMRYVEWTIDLDPDDDQVETDYVFILRDADGHVTVERERNHFGIFSMSDWREMLEATGFEVHFERLDHSELPPDSYYGIVALKN